MNNLTPESIPILWNSTEVPASLLMKQWKIMPVRGNFNHLIAWLLTLLTQTLMLHPVSQFFWFGRWRQSNLLKFSTLQKFGLMHPSRSGAWLRWLYLGAGLVLNISLVASFMRLWDTFLFFLLFHYNLIHFTWNQVLF